MVIVMVSQSISWQQQSASTCNCNVCNICTFKSGNIGPKYCHGDTLNLFQP